ncbi:MAG: hypothetical protein GY949_20115 [Gammaproteobacteria bacterium]|nr:hypothetical protein [Gammaproteobacteria bacterium]
MIKPSRDTILQRVVGTIGDFFKFVADSFTDDNVRRSILSDLDARPDTTRELQLDDDKLSALQLYRKRRREDLNAEVLISALDDIAALVEALVTFIEGLAADNDRTVDDFLHPFLDVMTVNYVRLRAPFFYWLGQPLGFVEGTISKHAAARFYASQALPFTRKYIIGEIFKASGQFSRFPRVDRRGIADRCRQLEYPGDRRGCAIPQFSDAAAAWRCDGVCVKKTDRQIRFPQPADA